MGMDVSVTQQGMEQVTAYISGFKEKAADLTVPMKQAAILMMGSVQKNFDASGRPISWIPLKASTLKEKMRKGYSPKPLIRTGGLRQSFATSVGRMEMSIGTSIVYGRIHQKGGRAGRNQSATIPARPYLVFQRDDLDKIRDLVVKHLTSGSSNA